MRISFVLPALLLASVALAESEDRPPIVEAVVVTVDVKGLTARPLAPVPAARTSAQEAALSVMSQRCALCHGASGRSDGIMSKTLQPRPRDLSDPAWQRAASDEQIRKVILGGGHAIGKSPIMPANPDLKQKADVVAELVRLIRSFEKRGVLRATLFGEDGEAQEAECTPDATGKQGVIRFPRVKRGTYAVRGYFDANEDDRRDASERGLQWGTVAVEDAPVSVVLKLEPRPRTRGE